MGHYNSFLIRIWTEDGENNIVRGYIQHVGSHESMHFRTIDKMSGFMLDHLGWHINGTTSNEVEGTLTIPQGDEPGLWEQS